MKYDITARLFPLIFDKYAYSCLQDKGITLSHKQVHKEYKAIVERTPSLPKDSSFIGNLLMGCYVLSFYKTDPKQITESVFRDLVSALCLSNPMVKGHKGENPFDHKALLHKEKEAALSIESKNPMDWQFTFTYDEDAFDLTYTSCGLCQLGKREKCFHLIKYLCEADYVTYDLMGTKLIRHHTLANGDECCDFHVERKEKIK